MTSQRQLTLLFELLHMRWHCLSLTKAGIIDVEDGVILFFLMSGFHSDERHATTLNIDLNEHTRLINLFLRDISGFADQIRPEISESLSSSLWPVYKIRSKFEQWAMGLYGKPWWRDYHILLGAALARPAVIYLLFLAISVTDSDTGDLKWKPLHNSRCCPSPDRWSVTSPDVLLSSHHLVACDILGVIIDVVHKVEDLDVSQVLGDYQDQIRHMGKSGPPFIQWLNYYQSTSLQPEPASHEFIKLLIEAGLIHWTNPGSDLSYEPPSPTTSVSIFLLSKFANLGDEFTDPDHPSDEISTFVDLLRALARRVTFESLLWREQRSHGIHGPPTSLDALDDLDYYEQHTWSEHCRAYGVYGPPTIEHARRDPLYIPLPEDESSASIATETQEGDGNVSPRASLGQLEHLVSLPVSVAINEDSHSRALDLQPQTQAQSSLVHDPRDPLSLAPALGTGASPPSSPELRSSEEGLGVRGDSAPVEH